MKQATAYLDWSLYVDCPNCEHDFDLVDQDSDNDYNIAYRIFNNQWDKLEGYEVTCPRCNHEFQIGKVEY